MNTWRVILATLVIFGTGLVAGGLLVKHTSLGQPRGDTVAQQPPVPAPATGPGHRGTNRAAFNSGAPMPVFMRKDFLKALDHEVELTAEQRERIEKILTEGQECTKQVWDKVAPDVRKEWMRVKDRIRAELNPEQRERFDELMKRKKQEERRPQPPRDEPRKDTQQPSPAAETPPANP